MEKVNYDLAEERNVINWDLSSPLSRVPRQLPQRGSLIKPRPLGEVAREA